MKTTKTLTTLTFLFALLLTSCAKHTVTNPDGSTITTYEFDKNAAARSLAAGGAAGGALLGQAIGHNTESTIIGGVLGGILGYITGNEVEKSDSYDRQSTQAPELTYGSIIFTKIIHQSGTTTRTGLITNGNKKFDRRGVYDTNGNFLGLVDIYYERINRQWQQTDIKPVEQ